MMSELIGFMMMGIGIGVGIPIGTIIFILIVGIMSSTILSIWTYLYGCINKKP